MPVYVGVLNDTLLEEPLDSCDLFNVLQFLDIGRGFPPSPKEMVKTGLVLKGLDYIIEYNNFWNAS